MEPHQVVAQVGERPEAGRGGGVVAGAPRAAVPRRAGTVGGGARRGVIGGRGRLVGAAVEAAVVARSGGVVEAFLAVASRRVGSGGGGSSWGSRESGRRGPGQLLRGGRRGGEGGDDGDGGCAAQSEGGHRSMSRSVETIQWGPGLRFIGRAGGGEMAGGGSPASMA